MFKKNEKAVKDKKIIAAKDNAKTAKTPRMNIDQSHLLMIPEPLERVVEETKEEKPVSV